MISFIHISQIFCEFNVILNVYIKKLLEIVHTLMKPTPKHD